VEWEGTHLLGMKLTVLTPDTSFSNFNANIAFSVTKA